MTLQKHSLHRKPFGPGKLQMEILILPSKAGAPGLGHGVDPVQTHEQAYVRAGKRLCLQASTQTSTWQEASSADTESPQASKSLVHSTECPQQPWQWGQPLVGQSSACDPIHRGVDHTPCHIPNSKAAGRTPHLTHGQSAASSTAAGQKQT